MSVTPTRARLLVGAVIAPLLILATPGVAEAAPTSNRADGGAGWLGRQLDADSHVVEGQFGPDYGLTADVVLALDAADVGRTTARESTRALRRHVLDYTGGGKESESYAGSFAKLILVAEARGLSARSFGRDARTNLVRRLRGLECGSDRRDDCARADRGRFSDRSEFGDFSSPLTQSLALIALDRATRRGPSTPSVRWLRTQQCDNGAFPLAVSEDDCTGSADATGFAVQALVQVGTPTARAAAQDAGRWLARRQHGNGSFTGNGERNANSTALAAQAFDALDRATRADDARSFLRSLQVGCAGRKANRGLVRYDRAGTGEALRATAQAVPALAEVTLGEPDGSGGRRGLPRLAC